MARYNGHLYGTPRSLIDESLRAGLDVILLNNGWPDVRNLYGGYRLASRILDGHNIRSR
jgi:guanylate kinase